MFEVVGNAGCSGCVMPWWQSLRLRLQGQAVEILHRKAASSEMRRCIIWKTSRMTCCALSGLSMCAAGSGAPQCACAGIPGHTGQASAGGLVANRNHEVHSRRVRPPRTRPRICCGRLGGHAVDHSRNSSTSGLTVPPGWLPALKAVKRPLPIAFSNALGDDAAGRVSGAQEKHVERRSLMSNSRYAPFTGIVALRPAGWARSKRRQSRHLVSGRACRLSAPNIGMVPRL